LLRIDRERVASNRRVCDPDRFDGVRQQVVALSGTHTMIP